MAIELNAPAVIPATGEKIYNEIWMSFFQAVATDPNSPVRVVAQIDKARTLENGKKELMPGGKQSIVISDFFAQATSEEIQIMGGLIFAIKARAGI